MTEQTFNVLFLCTGNSARSVLAEVLLNHKGEGQFRAFSAGSQQKGEMHPATIKLLKEKGHSTTKLTSQSWNDFAKDKAPVMDLVVTVCDSAASEACPFWPHSPVVSHWRIPDPAAVASPPKAVDEVFEKAYSTIDSCIDSLIGIVRENPPAETLRQEINAIRILR